VFPKLPSFEGLHPLVVHFPVALLLVAPALVVLSLLLRAHGRGLMLGALVLMALGTIGAWVSIWTGEAATELAAQGAPAVREAIERHRVAAGSVRTVFTVLTLLFAALTWLPDGLARRLSPRARLGLTLVLLGAWGGSMLLLAKAAHLGGLLVHEYGIRSPV